MNTRLVMGIAAVAALSVTLVVAQRGQTPAAQTRDFNLPPDAAAAQAQLDTSPRHAEWVDIKGSGATAIKSFVVYPERRDRAAVVIVIHEIFGLQDWVRGVADQLAKEGFIAIAPDLLSGRGPGGGATDAFADQNAVMQAIRNVTPDIGVSHLNAVRNYALAIPAANGRVGTIGFCWGGQTSFNYALNQPALDAAVSYYGPMPTDPVLYVKAKPPILGLFGGNDARVNANIPIADAELRKAGVTFTAVVYEGAGHGFLRQQVEPSNANMTATEQAWPRTLAFLRQHLRS